MFNKKRRNWARIQKGHVPRAPTTLSEVIEAFAFEPTMTAYGYTASDPRSLFYRGSVEAHGFSVFATEFVAKAVEAMSDLRLFGDGTFRVVPKSCFKQLYVIHCEVHNHVCYIL